MSTVSVEDAVLTSARLSQQAIELQVAAEQIFMACAREERGPDSRELIVLRQCGLDDEATIADERRRLRRVLDAMAIVGHAESLTNAERDRDEAIAAFDERVPQLAQQIAALQQQETELRSVRLQAERRVETLTSAREALTSVALMPRFVKELHSSARKATGEDRECTARLEAELEMMRGALKLSVSDRGTELFLQSFRPDLLNVKPGAGNRRRVNEEGWLELQDHFRERIPGVEQLVRNARYTQERKMGELCPLDWYLQQLPTAAE